MLISNGIVNRNINPAKLPEYAAKGYKEVKPAEGKENKSGKDNKENKSGKPAEGKEN